MRKKLYNLVSFIGVYFLWAQPVFAASNTEVAHFTQQTLNTLIVLASLTSAVFLLKGALMYIASSGKPESLESAKNTIRNALIGLVLVISAGVLSSLLSQAFTTPTIGTTASQIQLKPIEPVKPANGVTKVLLDAIAAFLQNIIQSATKPLTDGIIGFLTTTPSLISNSVIFNFWLIILGITDSLFALVIALLGFQFMSSSSFGFEEIELKQLLPRIGLAFLLANTSLFLAEWVTVASNTLVNALLSGTGGLTSAWVLNTIDPTKLSSAEPVLITLIFMLLFVILSVVLLLFYIMRLITLALGAVLSPLIFLLWSLPKFSDFAEISIKTYLVTIFTVFVHVVIIQLASAFLTLPGQSGTNSLISILTAVGLFFMLLKTPSFMMQMMFYNTGRGVIKKMGAQIMNVISSQKQNSSQQAVREVVKTPRRVVAA
jgi:hypothetical protein